jgi:uncharacterized protein YeaO (DUF488 family)
MAIKVKRMYLPFSKADGYRILVDRLWPRGIKKEDAHIGIWLKEVAPSNTLRKWFNHEPDKWQQFVERYAHELKGSTALEQLAALVKQHKTVTLLYAAKDEEHNQAIALQQFLKG